MTDGKAARWAVALLFVVPAVFVPLALDRFVFGKLLVAAIAIVLSVLAAPTGRLPRTVSLLLAAGGIVLAVSAVASSSPATAFWGRQPRSEGVFVLAVYLLSGFAGARLLGPELRPRMRQTALTAMSWCVTVVAAVAVLESLGYRPLSSDLDRPGSLLGNASDLGAVAVLYGGPLVVAALRTRARVVVMGAVGAGVAVVLSASRGALIGLAVVGALVLLTAGGKRLRAWAAAGIAVIVAAIFAIPATRSRVLDTDQLAAHTVNGRNLLWRETLSMLRGHWLLGVGPSQFENAIVSQHDRRWQVEVGPLDPPGSPHNVVLQVLSAGGVVLLVVVLWLAVLIVRKARARASAPGDSGWAMGLVIGLAGYAVALLFHLTSPGTTIPAAVFAGSLLAVSPAPVRAVQVRVTRIGVGAVAAVLSVVFLLAAAAEILLRAGTVAVNRGHYASADKDFSAARALRLWDADLDSQAQHAFVVKVTSGDRAADAYARKWTTRLAGVRGDEQVVDNEAALSEADGEYTKAAVLLDGALRRDPYNPSLLVLRGVVYARTGQFADATRVLLTATSVNPDDPKGWQDLAVVYRAQGKTALAAQADARAKAASTP